MKELSSSLKSIKSIKHGFYTNKGGVSKGNFSSLNCSPFTGDDPKNVYENLSRVCSDQKCEKNKLYIARQTHGNTAVIISSPEESFKKKADGIVTNVSGISIGILTADCAPILMVDPYAKVIGAAHAGWKGALGGIINSTVEKMMTLGARPNRIIAGIGPCISSNSYEIGSDLFDKFILENKENDRFFSKNYNGGKHKFNLSKYVQANLHTVGIREAEALEIDTFPSSTPFFSYRKAQENGEIDSGRQISIISLLLAKD